MTTTTELKKGTKIRNKTAGDDWTIRRRVVNIPTGQTLTKAWLTVKMSLDEEDSAAIIQKVVDTSEVDGVGCIEDNGAGGTGVVRFDLTKDDTVKLRPWQTYYYDMQVKTSQNKYDTPDDGTIIAKPQVTRAT